MVLFLKNNKNALAGNRTRAARVAGEHSTTEPPVLSYRLLSSFLIIQEVLIYKYKIIKSRNSYRLF